MTEQISPSLEALERQLTLERQARDKLEAQLLARSDELVDVTSSLKGVCDTLSARINELEDERSRVLHIGRTDSLTGLMNRGAFLAGLTEKLAAASRFGMTVGLYVVDLDRF